MSSPFGTSWSDQLVQRAERRGCCTDTVHALQVLGTAVDAGLIDLPSLLDLVRSCSTSAQLGDALTMLAATVPTGDQLQPAGGVR